MARARNAFHIVFNQTDRLQKGRFLTARVSVVLRIFVKHDNIVVYSNRQATARDRWVTIGDN